MSQARFFWKTVETFIGRDDVIKTLLRKAENGKFHLAAVSGGYGYGKTRILRQFLKKLAEEFPGIARPLQLIDLYQTEYHSAEGLAAGIAESFGAEHAVFFVEYDKAKKLRDEAKVAGASSLEIKNLTKFMLDECERGLWSLSQKKGFVLLLDTAERWAYPTLEDSPFSDAATAEAWKWLKEVCGKMSRGLIVLAGRPEIENLGLDEDEIIKLEKFSESETKEYVSETARLYRGIYKTPPFKFLDEEIHILFKLSEGRPILLALFLERVFHGDPTIREAAPTSSTKYFEPLLISHLMRDPQIGLLLATAGRAPKGVNLELLAQITGLPEDAIKDSFDILKEMSFAKIFQDNDRIFLHEEMYAMLERNVYSKEGDEADADTAAQAIYQYYKTKTTKLNKNLGHLYVAYAADRYQTSQNQLWIEIEQANQELQTLNTEFAYYRWRRASKSNEDPIEMGLRRYYRIGHEAAMVNDFETLLWLRFELIRFIQHLETKERQGIRQDWLPLLRGFLYIQKIWENNASGKPYADILPNFDKRLDDERKLILSGLMDIWKGIAISYGKEPDYKKAKEIFSEVIKQLKTAQALPWFTKGTIVLAYRQRAHIKKRQFLLNLAIQDLKRAASANRGLDFNFEEATIRNDLGDTQVLIGDFEQARLNLQDAFSMRQEMKNGTRLALSYSTAARYYIATNAFSQARNSARQGMNLSTRIGRGTALARISFAEATRRYAQQPGTPERRRDELFKEAEKALAEAVDGLEGALQIDAKIEQACLLRDHMRYADGIEKDLLFKAADKLFLEVYKTAEQQNHQNTYRMADAMANRIWLGMFKQDNQFAQKAADEFSSLKIFEFPIDETGSLEKYQAQATQGDKNPLVQFIGKYYIAKGNLMFGPKFELPLKNLHNLAVNWMLGLEYSLIFAESYRGLAAAEETIYNKIRTFNDQEISMLLEEIEKAENKINGKKDSRLKMLIKKSFPGLEEDDSEE